MTLLDSRLHASSTNAPAPSSYNRPNPLSQRSLLSPSANTPVFDLVDMTLVICVECRDGNLIATDSRVSYGEDLPLMREAQTKIDIFGGRFALTIVGSVGMAGKVLDEIQAEFHKTHIDSTRVFVELCEDASFKITKRYKERMEITDEDLDFFLVCTSKDGIFQISGEGISEPFKDYGCFGSSDLYGEYIIRQLYAKNSSIDEAAKWGVYAVKQATLMDPAVGGPIHLAFATASGIKVLGHEEISKIEQQISGESPEFQRDLFELIDSIVDARRTLNQTVYQSHRVSLFNQREAEIWALARPVVTEEQFTNRILALGVLIDEMTPPVNAGKVANSLQALEDWLGNVNASSEKIHTIIATLRDIRTLRNKTFPVHPDDAGFVSVVVRWGLSFPPDWARLYRLTIQKYSRTLSEIRALIDRTALNTTLPSQ